MKIGNYEIPNNRWNDHTWIWSVTHSCGAPDCGTYFVDPVINPETDNLNVIAIATAPKEPEVPGHGVLRRRPVHPDGRRHRRGAVHRLQPAVARRLLVGRRQRWQARSCPRTTQGATGRPAAPARTTSRCCGTDRGGPGSRESDVPARPGGGAVTGVARQEQAVRRLRHHAVAARAVAALELDPEQRGGPEPAWCVPARRPAEHRSAPRSSRRRRSRWCCRTERPAPLRARCPARTRVRCTRSGHRQERDRTGRPSPEAPPTALRSTDRQRQPSRIARKILSHKGE